MFQIASLVYQNHAPEVLLRYFVADLQSQGVKVGGVLQETHRLNEDVIAMELVEMDTGKRLNIRQDLGKGSQSCVMDTQVLAASSVAVRRGLAAGVDLMILNKFSHAEVEGRGFVHEFQQVTLSGVRLLTCVKMNILPQWLEFSGDLGMTISAQGEEKEILQNLWQWWKPQDEVGREY